MVLVHRLVKRKPTLRSAWIIALYRPKLSRIEIQKHNLTKLCTEVSQWVHGEELTPLRLRVLAVMMSGIVYVYADQVDILSQDLIRLQGQMRTITRTIASSIPTIALSIPTIAPSIPTVAPVIPTIAPTNLRNNCSLDSIDTDYLGGDLDTVQVDVHQGDRATITLSECRSSYRHLTGPSSYQHEVAPSYDHKRLYNSEESGVQIHGYAPSTGRINETENVVEASAVQHPAGDANRHADDEIRAPLGVPTQIPPIPRAQARRRVVRRRNRPILDSDIVISSDEYQSWLQDTSDITRTRKARDRIFTLVNLPTPSQLWERLYRGRRAAILENVGVETVTRSVFSASYQHEAGPSNVNGRFDEDEAINWIGEVDAPTGQPATSDPAQGNANKQVAGENRSDYEKEHSGLSSGVDITKADKGKSIMVEPTVADTNSAFDGGGEEYLVFQRSDITGLASTSENILELQLEEEPIIEWQTEMENEPTNVALAPGNPAVAEEDDGVRLPRGPVATQERPWDGATEELRIILLALLDAPGAAAPRLSLFDLTAYRNPTEVARICARILVLATHD